MTRKLIARAFAGVAALAVLARSQAVRAQDGPIAKAALTAATSKPSAQNARPGFLNVSPPALQKLHACFAMVRLGDGSCNLVEDGDSTTAALKSGLGPAASAPALRSRSRPTQLAQMLAAAGIPAEADSWFGNSNIGTNISSYASYNPVLSAADSGWVLYGGGTLGNYGWCNNSTAGALISTFTSGYAFDRVTVYSEYITAPPTPSFTVDVGGNNTTTITQNLTTNGFDVNTVALSTPVAGGTPINIKRTQGLACIVGVHAWNSTVARVGVLNIGWSGATSTNLADTTGPRSALSATVALGAAGYVLNVGINNWRSSTAVTPAQTVTDVSKIITALQATGASVVASMPIPSNVGDTPQATQDTINSALYSTYANLGVPVIDMKAAWTNWAAANAAGLIVDTLHPNGPGYGDWAQRELQLLLSQ